MVKNKSAFTMIEMIIVLGMISILVIIGTVAFSLSAKTSHDATRRANLESISGILEEYNNKYSTYPINETELDNYYELIDTVKPSDPKTKEEYSYSPLRCTQDGLACGSYILSTIMEVTNTTYSVDKYGEIK